MVRAQTVGLRALGRSVAAALVVLTLGSAAGAGAQPGPPADWQATALVGSVARVFATADGALLAQTSGDALFRSDDRGVTFRPIPLPPRSPSGGPRVLEVDPADGDVIYATGDAGLSKSGDGGGTYAPILPGGVAGVSVSPADPRLVYVGAAGAVVPSLRFLRSRDGGATFEPLEELRSENPGCTFGLSVLQADASDPRRLFRSASCTAGRDLASPTFTRPLERSLDQGATFATVARPPGGFADRLVGGAGSMPGRYYLSDLKPFFGRPASLYRSDDGGSTFAQVFQFPRVEGEAGPSGAGPQTAIGGLAYDPARPDRVFVGRRNRATGVLTSGDAGVTFAELGRPDIGEILDLALSADGLDLYAATTEGLFRLSLRAGLPSPGGPAPAQVPPRPGGR